MSDLDPVLQFTEAFSRMKDENLELRESIEEIRAQFAYEDRGWQTIFGFAAGERSEGLSLDEVKLVSEKARTRVAASSLVKRASDLHGGYVFGNGVTIEGTERVSGAGRGRPAAGVNFFEDSVNQESIFSDSARKELQRARFTDGNVIVFCESGSRRVRRVPLHEIDAVITNPDYPEEIWAWRRAWSQHLPSGEVVVKKAWAYSNRFDGNRRRSINDGVESVPVLDGVTAVDLRANRQVGWAFGIPDALAGLHWVEAYGEVLRYGQIVSESLAKIVFKVVSKSSKGAANVGVKLRSQAGHGGAAVFGEGQDLQLVNSSQRSFDFTAARPLAAMAASAWNVSNIDLLSDSSAAGSSYGAASALTAGIENAMVGIQADWTQFYQDIFQVLGFGRPAVHWAPLERPDAYRQAQELSLYSVALTDAEYRAAVLSRLDIPGDPNVIPPSLAARVAVPVQAASPDQGQSNGTGGASSADRNDLRSDTIS